MAPGPEVKLHAVLDCDLGIRDASAQHQSSALENALDADGA